MRRDTRQSLSSLAFVVINESRHPSRLCPRAVATEGPRKEDDGRAALVTLWSRRNSGCDLIFFSFSLSLPRCVSEGPVSHSRGRGRAKRVSWLAGRSRGESRERIQGAGGLSSFLPMWWRARTGARGEGGNGGEWGGGARRGRVV